MAKHLRPTDLSNAAGISVPYASQLLNNKRIASEEVAIKIFRATGVKLAPISELSDREIAILEKMRAAA